MDSYNSMTLNIHLSPHPSYSRCHHGSILLKTDTTINENLMSVKHVTLIHTLKTKNVDVFNIYFMRIHHEGNLLHSGDFSLLEFIGRARALF